MVIVGDEPLPGYRYKAQSQYKKKNVDEDRQNLVRRDQGVDFPVTLAG
jgi:hypothetical protein